MEECTKKCGTLHHGNSEYTVNVLMNSTVLNVKEVGKGMRVTSILADTPNHTTNQLTKSHSSLVSINRGMERSHL